MRASSSGGNGPHTLTGMRYEPDFNVNWGAKAGIGLAMAGGGSIQAFGGFELEARADNSISKLGIMANISMANDGAMVDPEIVKNIFFAMSQSPQLSVPGGITSKLKDDPKDKKNKEEFKILGPPPSPALGFSAFAMVKFDFDQKSFYGEIGADASLKAVRIAGMGAMLVSPDKNFLHLGEPPAGRRILVKVPSVPQFDGYFMIGDLVPELPAPYPNIFDLYPAESSKRIPNNLSAVTSGKGIAFGAAVELSNSNSYKLLSWNLGVRAGLDMVIVKYPNGTSCYGLNSPDFGLNNWRAMGQVYVIGWFDFQALGVPVLNLGIGALLKGSTPNPTNASGQVAVSFRVLFKKYEYRAKFQVGDECEIVTGEEKVTEDPIITTVYPLDGQTISDEKLIGFEVMEDFNKNLDLPELKYPTQVKMVSYKLFKGSEELGGLYSLNGKNAYYLVGRPLENNTIYNYQIKVQVQEMVAGNWQPLILGGKEISDSKSASFKYYKTAEQLGEEMANNGEAAGNNISLIGQENLIILNNYLNQDITTVKALSVEAAKAIDAMLDACGSTDSTCIKIALAASGILKSGEDTTVANIQKLQTDYGAKIRAAIAQDSAMAYQAGYAAQNEILKNGVNRLNADFTSFKQNFYINLSSIPCAQTFLQKQGLYFHQVIENPAILNNIIDDNTGCLDQILSLKNKFIEEKDRLVNYYTQINNGIINNTIEETIRLQNQAAAKARKLVDEATNLSQAEKDNFYALVQATVTGAFHKFSTVEGFNQKFDTQNLDEYIKKFEKIVNEEQPTISCENLPEPIAAQYLIIDQNTLEQSGELSLYATGCVAGSKYRWEYINKDNILKNIEGNNVKVSDYYLNTTFEVACVSKGCESGKKKAGFKIYIQKTKTDGCKYIESPTLSYSTLNITKGDSIKVSAKGCQGGYEWSSGAQTDASLSEQIFNPASTNTYWVRCRNTSIVANNGATKVLEENRDIGDNITNTPPSTTCKDEYLKNSFTINVEDGCQKSTPYLLVQNIALAKNEKFELKAYGCPEGKFYWTSKGKVDPLDMNANPLQVNITENTQYQVYCKNDLCTSGLTEKVTINIVEKNENGGCLISKPIIAASRTVVTDVEDRSQAITFTASGCPVGSTYKWSLKDPDGQNYVGESLEVATPNSPLTVSAFCLFSTCMGVHSDPINIQINDPCQGLKYPEIVSNSDNNSILTGTPVKLTDTNCPTEYLRWSNGVSGAQSISFVADITSQTRSYTVSCQKEGCSKTHFSKTFDFVVQPCDISPAISFSDNNRTLIYDPQDGSTKNAVTATATGCSGAQVSWEINGNYISNSSSISINTGHFQTLNNGQNLTLQLTCLRTYCETKTSSQNVKLFHFDNCKTIQNYSLSISANKSSHNGDGITLTASGCPHNVYWSDGQQGTSITMYHRGTINYSATCSINGCASSISSNAIELYYDDPCSNYYSGPQIYQPNDGTQTLQAYNCLNDNYLWNTGAYSSRIKVANTDNYTVTCADYGCGSFSKTYYWTAPPPPIIDTPTDSGGSDPGSNGSTDRTVVVIYDEPVVTNPPATVPSGGVTLPPFGRRNKILNLDIE